MLRHLPRVRRSSILYFPSSTKTGAPPIPTAPNYYGSVLPNYADLLQSLEYLLQYFKSPTALTLWYEEAQRALVKINFSHASAALRVHPIPESLTSAMFVVSSVTVGATPQELVDGVSNPIIIFTRICENPNNPTAR